MGEAYKPSWGETQKGKEAMSEEQMESSRSREELLSLSKKQMPIMAAGFVRDIGNSLNSFENNIDEWGKLGREAGGAPDELTADMEQAKRIQAEIRQKLEELKALKFGAPE